MNPQCIYSETEANMQLAVSRRRPYGPPLHIARWFVRYIFCKRVIIKTAEYLLSLSKYWKISFPMQDYEYIHNEVINNYEDLRTRNIRNNHLLVILATLNKE